MSEERLKEAEEWMQGLKNLWAEAHDTKETTMNMIKRCFLKRFTNRKPLNDEVIYRMILGGKYPNNWEKIKAFARAIEKEHGITGGGE